MNGPGPCFGAPHLWQYVPALSPNDCCPRCGAVRPHDPSLPSLSEIVERMHYRVPPISRGAE